MAKGIGHVILIIKAILTRVIFGTHGFIAIWRVTTIKKDPYYWYLCATLLALAFEGVFTLTIKKNQEWKWFCPSVFFYLCSVVPAIWVIEVDRFDRNMEIHRLKQLKQNLTMTLAANVSKSNEELAAINTFGVNIQIPLELDAESWATVIEQLLMLILIIGRWMLPKGGLTRDQLSQLLLVYIGTAADIIEFFDSFKDEKIASQRVLCLLILSIWSWSLMQFTFVLTATKARRTRITADIEPPKPKLVNGIYKVKEVCCSIDVWAILINIILQDAPFLIFRTLLIFYFKIISYMNIFFTCKNTLVIILQFYRLYVVQQEKNKELSKMAKASVSGNLAKVVHKAAFIGPTTNPKFKGGKGKETGSAGKTKSTTTAAGKAKKQQNKLEQSQPKKNPSQDSINSQRQQSGSKIPDASKMDNMKLKAAARRKSLSTGNLPEEIEATFMAERPFEDDLEVGMSGSVMSGTNDGDSQDVESEDVALDEISFASELPTTKINRKIRMSDSPGVYKISGSRSSEASSSQQGHNRCRQDTGYSSSSKDSANSSRRGRSARNGGRGGRQSATSKQRAKSAAQRRRQMMMGKPTSSIEFGIPEVNSSSESSGETMAENERIFQRRAAIGAVFALFVVIFMLCMVAIYGGINPKGLVLRENLKIVNSTSTTTQPPPTTIVPSTNITTTNFFSMNYTTPVNILVNNSGVQDPQETSGKNDLESSETTQIVENIYIVDNFTVSIDEMGQTESSLAIDLNVTTVGDILNTQEENDEGPSFMGTSEMSQQAPTAEALTEATIGGSEFELPKKSSNVRHLGRKIRRLYGFLSESFLRQDN